MPKFIQQPSTVQKSQYTTSVPFSKELILVDHLLTSNDVLIPSTLNLLIGAKTIYKLTADGTHAPVFGSPFVVDPGSIAYNKLAGAVNLVTMIYDGVAFRVTLTSYTDVEKAPYFVADYNLGAGVIVIATNHVRVPAYAFIPEWINDEDVSYQVSAFDLLSSVHYLGDLPLTYSIQVPYSEPVEWISSNDPKEAKLVLGGNSTGPFFTFIKVTDGDLTSNTCPANGIFIDPNSNR